MALYVTFFTEIFSTGCGFSQKRRGWCTHLSGIRWIAGRKPCSCPGSANMHTRCNSLEHAEQSVPDSVDLGELSSFQMQDAERYRDDATGQRGQEPLAIYAPRNAQECALVLRILNAARQPCVVQGGRTGLAGGARIRDGEVVLSTERMRGLVEIDDTAGLMRVGAGTSLEEAQNAAAEAGWMLAADLGARGSATIGGMIATNAGGPLAVRYGTLRNQVLGLEAVLADGTIVDRMSGLWKDNTGYNLLQMIMAARERWRSSPLLCCAFIRLRACRRQRSVPAPALRPRSTSCLV
jgi:hypothetical protein